MQSGRFVYVRAYLWAVWGTGIWYLTSSGVIAVLGVIERWLNRPVSSSIFWCIALAGIFWVCYRAWKIEHLEKLALIGDISRRPQGRPLASRQSECLPTDRA